MSRSSTERACQTWQSDGKMEFYRMVRKVLKRRKEVKTALDVEAFHHLRQGRNTRAMEFQLESILC